MRKLSTESAKAKVLAFLEWKKELPVEKKEWLDACRVRLSPILGEQSANELLAEILLLEHRRRNEK